MRVVGKLTSLSVATISMVAETAAVIRLYLKQNRVDCQTEHDSVSCYGGNEWNKRGRMEQDLQRQLHIFRHQYGIPGLSFMVTANGQQHLTSIGHSDVENNVPCDNTTVMRIASISKPLTSVAVMKLFEEGKLELDKPIHKYVKGFPVKTYEGVPVDITTRQLLTHTGGIRDYDKSRGTCVIDNTNTYNYEEFYITEHYDSVTDSLKIFQNNDLIAKPGTTYCYTTHGYTLLSAVVEGVSGMDFLPFMKENVFGPLSMMATVPEFNDVIIPRRSRYYKRDSSSSSQLLNVPYVDISYKWAGGGFLSTVEDLVSFGNALLLSYNEYQRRNLKGAGKEEATQKSKYILEPSTVNLMWSSGIDTRECYRYSLGWCIERDDSEGAGVPLVAYHTGGAIGASSVLVIVPGPVSENDDPNIPKGVVLAMLVNLHNVSNIAGQVGKNLALNVFKYLF